MTFFDEIENYMHDLISKYDDFFNKDLDMVKKHSFEQKLLEDTKKIDDKIFCKEKVNSLKSKYGDKIYYKLDEKNKQILYIGYSNSETINLSDFIEHTTIQNIFKGDVIESKIGNIEKIVFNNCANLNRIHDYVEGLITISLNNCPNISEIDCYDKVQKIWIDRKCISFVSKFMPIVKEDAKKVDPPDYLIDFVFNCEIIEDPVIAFDGITYNRSEIEEWFKNHDISPKTGETLKSKSLIPNISIRNAIEEWKKSNPQ
jgi:hypothetical protein